MYKIDLDGPQGNAFYIIGLARKIAKAEGMSDEMLKTIQEDMTSGDYEHLLEVFNEHFSDHVMFV